jgi:very-short-patch-repair endonuclease
VAGTLDYLTFTSFYFPAGVVDVCLYSFLFTFIFMNNKNLFNRKSLKSFRSSLRNNSTSAEAALWFMLKSKKLEGRKFRRQYSISSYIVDFCCPSEKLIIELDGNPHGEYHIIHKDENRDKYLESLGFIVLRFENRFVFQDPEYVKDEIRKILNKRKTGDMIE